MARNIKKALFFFCVIIVLALAIAWLALSSNRSADTGKLRVVTTLFPSYDMARHIGGSFAEVSLLLPPGVESHSFDPTPRDVVAINTAGVFVYTGHFMEPWAADVLNSVSNKKLVVVDASKGTTMVPSAFRDADKPAGSLDSHIWLDLDNAKIMAQNIAEGLSLADPGHQKEYQANLDIYVNQLSYFDQAYRTALASCSNKEIVYAGHYAFGYLARRYGLQYVAAQGVSPDAEPTANDLASLVDQIKRSNIKYVFYEELTSPKIAETIAKETNSKLLLLNAAHNLSKEQLETGMTFFDILKSNLANLKIGLGCQKQ